LRNSDQDRSDEGVARRVRQKAEDAGEGRDPCLVPVMKINLHTKFTDSKRQGTFEKRGPQKGTQRKGT